MNWKSRFFLPSPHVANVMRQSASLRQLQAPAGPNLLTGLPLGQLQQNQPGKYLGRRVGENPSKGRSHLMTQNVNVKLSSPNLKIWLNRQKQVQGIAHLGWHTLLNKAALDERAEVCSLLTLH